MGANVAGGQQPPAQARTHTVKRGDTLWDIAKTYLGDPFLWPEIYRLNTDIVQDPHWIYPGEVLKLPGAAAAVAAVPVTPTPTPTPTPVPVPVVVNPTPAPPPVARVDTQMLDERAHPAVRYGEFLAAPFVDQRGGPSTWGRVIGSAELTVNTPMTNRTKFDLYDKVLISPPGGSSAREKELYVAYVVGPLIENFGQIIIPTGIVQVTRSPGEGEATVARVVRLFASLDVNQRLMPYDSSAWGLTGRPSPITNGPSGTVRWMYKNPVAPGVQQYLVLDLGRREGLMLGDMLEFYQPRKRSAVEGELATPELSIGHAQVVKVTPYGSTAVITSVDQPKITEGTSVRVSAKMR